MNRPLTALALVLTISLCATSGGGGRSRVLPGVPVVRVTELVAPGDTSKWLVTVTAAPATLSSPAPTGWHVRFLGADTTKDPAAGGDYLKALLYHQFNPPRNIDTVFVALPLNFTDSVGPLSVAARGVNQFGVGAFARSFTWYAKRRGTPPPPPVVGVDTTNRIAAILAFPSAATLALGTNRVVCSFQQFTNGAVTQWTAEKPSCDSIATAYVPAAARALVTPAQQAHTDSLTQTCVTWSTNATTLLLTPRTSCSSAVVVTGVGLTLRPDQLPYRYARWVMGGPVLAVSSTGLATCLRPGVGVVQATIGGVAKRASVTCVDPRLPSFLASLQR